MGPYYLKFRNAYTVVATVASRLKQAEMKVRNTNIVIGSSMSFSVLRNQPEKQAGFAKLADLSRRVPK